MTNQPTTINVLAFRRGKIDFLANAPAPYPRNSKEFQSWLAGWQTCLQHKDKCHVVALRSPKSRRKH